MDILEIRESVGHFLETKDLATAALVCKSWNACFTSLLYYAIEWHFDRRRPGINRHATDHRK
jgi:hypothetical protein